MGFLDGVFTMLHFLITFSCDVTSRTQIVDMVQKVKQQVGVVTILVNNAGIMPTHPLLQQTEQEISKTFQINVMAHFWVLRWLMIASEQLLLTPNQLDHSSSFKPFYRT